MSPIVKPDESRVYILTEKQTETVRSLRDVPQAVLTFADNKTYVSVSAEAAISDDRALIERLWNPGAQAFWPEGPGDAKVCALVLTPHAGEYWDGDNRIAAGIKMLLANVTGAQPDLGDHGEVRL
jgi:general stress protein 26